MGLFANSKTDVKPYNETFLVNRKAKFAGSVRRRSQAAAAAHVLSRALSGGVDGVRSWEVATGKELHHFTGQERLVYRVALSADSRRALSGSQDQTVRLWDLESGTELQVFRGHADEITTVAFAPDGKQALSCSVDHIMLLWDLETEKELRRFAGGSYMAAEDR